jgi:hypothetical protein
MVVMSSSSVVSPLALVCISQFIRNHPILNLYVYSQTVNIHMQFNYKSFTQFIFDIWCRYVSHYCNSYDFFLTLPLPLLRICINISTVYNDMLLVAKGLKCKRAFNFFNDTKDHEKCQGK